MQTGVIIKTADEIYTFDAVLSSIHDNTLTVTENPVQSGAAVSDHAYYDPKELTLDIGMTDCARSIIEGQYEGGSSRSVEAYQLLCRLQRDKTLMKILTRLDTYKNMVITSISTTDDFKTANALRAKITFKEIIAPLVKTVEATEWTEPEELGTIPVEQVTYEDMSILLNMDNGSGQLFSNMIKGMLGMNK